MVREYNSIMPSLQQTFFLKGLDPLPQNSLTEGKPPKEPFSTLENTPPNLTIKPQLVNLKQAGGLLLPQHVLENN